MIVVKTELRVLNIRHPKASGLFLAPLQSGNILLSLCLVVFFGDDIFLWLGRLAFGDLTTCSSALSM